MRARVGQGHRFRGLCQALLLKSSIVQRQDCMSRIAPPGQPVVGSLMRHFKSRRNAFLVEFGVTRSLLYFPDTNETTWRWSSASERAPD